MYASGETVDLTCDGAIMNMETILENFGFPALTVVMLAVSIWKSAMYVGRRLFDPDSGIVTNVAQRHILFLDQLGKTTDGMLEAQKRHAQEMSEQTRALAQLTSHTQILAGEIQRLQNAVPVQDRAQTAPA